ncbi:hypothetical protein C6W19_20800 [Bacillus sp. RJGP41]|nr:hypothetical protein C6W19_20800 [Bacillus sp. RJGP41]
MELFEEEWIEPATENCICGRKGHVHYGECFLKNYDSNEPEIFIIFYPTAGESIVKVHEVHSYSIWYGFMGLIHISLSNKCILEPEAPLAFYIVFLIHTIAI